MLYEVITELNAKLEKAREDLDKRYEYFEKRRLEIKEQRRLLELEAEGTLDEAQVVVDGFGDANDSDGKVI